MSLFKRAQKTESKLRLAIAGPSGSGKTYSALSIATGLAQGETVAVIDTEHGSASKYADLFEFDTAVMTAPYHPDKYVRAIKEAEEAGYKVLILDSLTHAWNGEGGLLSIVEDIAARMKTSNSYAAWKDATPIQNRLIEAMLAADLHIIATMRSKQEYSMEKDSNGRTTIRKVGMAPVQRDGMEYEMDIFLDMDMDNNAIVQKTRCPAITGKVFKKPNGELSETLLAWLGSGAAVTVAEAHASPSNDESPKPKKEKDAAQLASESFHAGGTKLFGKEWDKVRPDVVKTYSAEKSPENVRTSSKELNPDEHKALAKSFKDSSGWWKKWLKENMAEKVEAEQVEDDGYDHAAADEEHAYRYS